MKDKICAVVVTYNRRDCLINLLKSLEQQTLKLDGIFIFDNFSNDGTKDKLLELGYCSSYEPGKLNSVINDDRECYYYRNTENSGGSGGFSSALEIASNLDYDYLWCMDDDVLAEKTCLENLVKHMTPNVGICIPTRTDELYEDFAITNVNMTNPFFYNIQKRKERIQNCDINGDTIEVVDMPFEGPLIKNDLIKCIGFPKKDFFIIFDDSEYAKRACSITKILYCKDAVLHKQIIPMYNSKKCMDWKNYYGYRNQIWFDRHYGENIFVKIFRPNLLVLDLSLRAIFRGKFSNLKVIKLAYVHGINDRLGKLVEPGKEGKDF